MSRTLINLAVRSLLDASNGAVSSEPSGCQELPPVDPNQYSLYQNIHDIQPHSWAWMFSGIAAFIATLLSVVLIYQHLRNFNKPNVQKHIVRILIMVPIYAIDSWFSFRFYRYGVYLDVIRDTYEAFVIYEFVVYLIELLGGHEGALLSLQSKEKPIQLPLPLCKIKLNPETKSSKFLRRVRQGCIQYVIIKPVTTCIAVATQLAGVYCSGNISPSYAWFYITVVVFFSVTIAMYSLVAFYAATREFLAPHRPFLKFLAIKFVIFFSFWQGVVVSGFEKIDVIHATTYWTADNVASGVQNLLVTIEMVIAAIFHIFCFTYKDFVVDSGAHTDAGRSFLIAINIVDVAKDTHKHIVPKKHHDKFGVQRESTSKLPIVTPVDEYGNPKENLQESIEMENRESDEEIAV